MRIGKVLAGRIDPAGQRQQVIIRGTGWDASWGRGDERERKHDLDTVYQTEAG